MDQAIHIDAIKFDENAKGVDAGDGAVELLSQLVLHVLTLEPGFGVAGGLVGAALGTGAVLADALEGGLGVVEILGLAAIEQVFDGAMDNQIRITADGGGEVGVGRIGQPEVADIVRAVHGLLHGAQQHGLDQPLIGPLAHRLQQGGVILGGGLLAARQCQPQLVEELAQVVELFLLGRLVDAEQGRHLLAFEVARRRHVGRQHALLNDAMGIVADQGMDGGDTTLIRELEAGLGGIELNGTPLFASLEQHLVQGVQLAQVGQDGGEARAQVQVAIHQHGRHLIVRQAGLGPHHGRIKLGARDLAVQAHQQFAAQTEPVHLGIDGTETIRQDLGQHGDDAIREIDRIAPAVGLGVQGAARRHIGRDIGDADQQPPALGAALAENGVVEVAGIGTVNGHQRDLAQIHPPRLGRLGHLGAQPGDLRQHRLGELHRQVVGADGDIRLHARGHVVPHHFQNAADGLGALGGLVRDLGDHDLALLHLAQAVAGNDDVVGQALVVRHHEADPTLPIEAPHHRAGVARQDLHHRPFQPAPGITAGDAHHGPVVVEKGAHLAGNEIDVVAALVRDQEAESVLVADDAPDDEVAPVDETEGVLAVAHELAVANHGPQAALQGNPILFAIQFKKLPEFLEDQGDPGLGQGLQDEFTAGDGVRVLARLAGTMRVGEAG